MPGVSSSVHQVSQCRTCTRSPPRLQMTERRMPSSSAPSSSPVTNVSGARSDPSSSMGLSGSLQLAVTVTPSGMPRKFNTRRLSRSHPSGMSRKVNTSVRHRPDRAVKTFREHDGGCYRACCHTAGRWPRLPSMSSPVVTSASLTGLCLIIHTVDTNFRGDIFAISHRRGVGHDSVDSYRPAIVGGARGNIHHRRSSVGIVHVIVVPSSESTSLPSPEAVIQLAWSKAPARRMGHRQYHQYR